MVALQLFIEDWFFYEAEFNIPHELIPLIEEVSNVGNLIEPSSDLLGSTILRCEEYQHVDLSYNLDDRFILKLVP